MLSRLALVCAGLVPLRVRGAWQDGNAGDEKDAAEVQKLGEQAGLSRFGKSRSEHFLALGDAPDDFLQSALRHCEALAQAFLKHFQAKGFRLVSAPRRLIIVVLKDVKSYGALLREAPGKDVGGHYDLETNRLVMFDFRHGKELPVAAAERLNLFTLVHETAHQLSFNTGLFQRTSMPPLCLSEGLATYVELWDPGGKGSIGGINQPRLKALRNAEDWISIGDLLASDDAFKGDSEQLAYAESWLLVHHFFRSKAQLPHLRDYFEAVRTGINLGQAKSVAEKLIGPLAKLDKVLKDEARRYLQARG
jgi:hypothetical protein